MHNFGTQTHKNNNTCFGAFTFHGHSTANTGTCINCLYEQGDLFYSVSPHRNRHELQPTQEKLRKGFGENAGEWIRRVEISKEETLGTVEVTSIACMAIY